MAPLSFDLNLGKGSMTRPARFFQRRDNLPPWTIATFVILLAVYIIRLIGLVWRRLRWNKARDKEARPALGPNQDMSRKQNDWLRKNSNVIWSTYIEEDDLKSQFALPRSRLFSIGSVSTVEEGRCPLDNQTSSTGATTQGLNKGTEPPRLQLHLPNDDETFRTRAAYEQDVTPTKQSRRRAMSQPQQDSPSIVFADARTRKQILPISRVHVTNNLTYGTKNDENELDGGVR